MTLKDRVFQDSRKAHTMEHKASRLDAKSLCQIGPRKWKRGHCRGEALWKGARATHSPLSEVFTLVTGG